MRIKLCLSLSLILMLSVACNTTPPDTTEPLSVSNTTALNVNHRVIYELNLYNFTKEGTLAAAQVRLKELRTLGIDIVWLMPIQPRSKQGKIGSLGSPYALQDYTKVNPDHGTLSDLINFVNEAHNLGIEVWLDWVPNHTGLDHVWVTEHPEYYQTKDGKIVHPNDYGDVYQLNYSNSAMQQAMIDAVKYWVKEASVDGFRFDYISSPAIPASFWKRAIPEIKNAAPDKRIWMLAEGDLIDRKDLYDVGFDYDYAWNFHDSAAKQVGATDKAKTLRSICQTLVSNSRYDNMDRMVYLTNHDDGNDGKNYFSDFGVNVPLMTVLEFTLYGMPLLYNGQEIGYRPVQDYFNRSVINWNSINRQLKNTIATLVALRHLQPALGGGIKSERGVVTFLDTGQPSLLCYTKTKGDNTVLVALNFATEPVTFTLSSIEQGRYSKWLDSETVHNDATLTHTTLSPATTFTLESKGYSVWVKE